MGQALAERLDCAAQNASLADGTPCRTIGAHAVDNLSAEMGITGRMVEIAALKKAIIPDRYLRNMQTLTVTDQIGLLESSVCVVGLGGLGGMVTESLARLGIGRLHLVDGDAFEGHNLNRQLFSSIDRLGLSKVDAAVMRLKTINPGLEVNAAREFLSPQNGDRLLKPCYLVVDCLDNIQSRFTLEAAAKQTGIPMVSAAVAGLSGHVTTIFPEDCGLKNIYGPPEQLKANKGAETRLGCLAPGVNLIASLECNEVLNVLLKRKNHLGNRLLVVDLTDYTFETLRLA